MKENRLPQAGHLRCSRLPRFIRLLGSGEARFIPSSLHLIISYSAAGRALQAVSYSTPPPRR